MKRFIKWYLPVLSARFIPILGPISAIAIFSAIACHSPETGDVKLSAGVPGVALEDSTILIAVPIENEDRDPASRVEVTEIKLDSLHRTGPSLDPALIGDILPGQRRIVEASFHVSGMLPDQNYHLTISGHYQARGRNAHFSLTRLIPTPARAPGEAALRQVQVRMNAVRGTSYRHFEIHIPKEVNEPGPPTPTGRRRGALRPSTQVSRIDRSQSGGGAKAKPINYQASDIVFVTNTGLAGGAAIPLDPSGASGGLVAGSPGVVLVTGNTYADFSVDGGQTFIRLDPTTIFPNADSAGTLIDGGLCCDQVVHYDASTNRFFWLMLFRAGADGNNRLRVATSSPEALAASGGTAWLYLDVTSASVGQPGMPFDYPDLSVGDHSLYASADINGGLMVFRLPLLELAAGGTVNIGYTDPKYGVSAFGRHLIQNSADELFWAGYPTTSALRVFSMKESSNQYQWKDIDIDSYPFGDFVSNGPDGTNWLASVFSGGPGGVRLRTAASDEIWFEWMAGRGGGFPQPHIQYVRLNRSDLHVIEQSQIWNDLLAFNYASFTAVNGKVGAALAYGGSADFGAPAVGIMGDGVFYAPCTSSANSSRYGDYSTVRQAWPNMYLFSATVYCAAAGGFDERYLLFGRSDDVNPVVIGATAGSSPRRVALSR